MDTPLPDASISPSLNPSDETNVAATDDVVSRARKRYDYAVSVDAENRKAEADDLRFAWVKGEQWNEGARRRRDQKQRPWLEFNQTKQFIKKIVNDIRQSRPSITVRPTGSGASQASADLRSGLVRHIEYDSNAEQAYDACVEQAATGGRGYLRVTAEYESETSPNQKLVISSIANGLAVVMDPDCQKLDKSDAKYCFVIEFLDRNTFEEEWGKDRLADGSWDVDGHTDYQDWWSGDKVAVCDYYEIVTEKKKLYFLPGGKGMWEDDPQFMQLAEGAKAQGLPLTALKSTMRDRKRVDWYKLSAAPKPLDKYDYPGKYIPVIMMVGDQMDVEGKKIYKGVVRDIRDAQMLFNYWFTAATEMIALSTKSPYIGLAGQFENHPEWESANTEQHAYLEYAPVEVDGQFITTAPVRTPTAEVPAAYITMCGQASDLLRQITGIKEASLAEQTQSQEPFASLLNRQQQSDVITFNFPDNARNSIKLVGTVVNDLIPHIYDSDRVINQLNVDGTQKQVRVNHQQPAPNQPMPMPGQPPAPPVMQTVNDLTVGDFDIVIDVGPSYQTKRLQAATEITDFMQLAGDAQKPLILPLAAKAMDWPDKLGEQMAGILTIGLPPPVQSIINGESDDPQVISLQGQLQQLSQTSQKTQQQLQQHIQQLTMALQKAQTSTLTAQAGAAQAKTSAARAGFAAEQKVAQANTDLLVQQYESQDTAIHTAMDGKELQAKITQDRMQSEIDMLARVVVPLLALLQKPQVVDPNTVGTEAQTLDKETQSMVGTTNAN